MANPDAIFQALEGRWRFDRTLSCRFDADGRMVGEASFTTHHDGALLYHETGTLTLDHGAVLTPEKNYLWRIENERIHIYFRDGATKGQLFHALDPTQGAIIEATHWCAPDTYETAYDFAGLPEAFTIKHIVQGPKKDNLFETSYTRLSFLY